MCHGFDALVTIKSMRLIIPDALPPLTIASTLADGLAAACPELIQGLAHSRAEAQPWSVPQSGCTPAEGLQLQLAGYPVIADQPLSAGLGPWRASVTDSAATVWIADFCGTVITQERATLIAQDQLQISAPESDALTAVIQEALNSPDSPWRIEPLSAGRWRVHGALPQPERVISPAALQGRDLGDWWPLGDAWRQWRRCLNEIQMAWHEHPVNIARQARGQPPINSVWLYGGARGWTPRNDPADQWLTDLSAAAAQADWHAWLQAWARLADRVLKAGPHASIVLTGEDRWVRLVHSPRSWWRSLLGRSSPNAWRDWWANPA